LRAGAPFLHGPTVAVTQGRRVCTGTLIAPEYVLTSCFPETAPGDPTPPPSFVDAQTSAGSSVRRDVAECFVHPQFFLGMTLGAGTRCADLETFTEPSRPDTSLILLRLDEPISAIPPARILPPRACRDEVDGFALSPPPPLLALSTEGLDVVRTEGELMGWVVRGGTLPGGGVAQRFLLGARLRSIS